MSWYKKIKGKVERRNSVKGDQTKHSGLKIISISLDKRFFAKFSDVARIGRQSSRSTEAPANPGRAHWGGKLIERQIAFYRLFYRLFEQQIKKKEIDDPLKTTKRDRVAPFHANIN